MLDRLLATTIAAVAAVTGFACSQAAPKVDADGKDLAVKWKDTSFYGIDAKALDGTDANLAQYEGKVALVVNVASQCGLTPQYAALQKLHEKFVDDQLFLMVTHDVNARAMSPRVRGFVQAQNWYQNFSTITMAR